MDIEPIIKGYIMTELNHGDILTIISIIDVAAQRGVFSGDSLMPVGQLYTKLKNIDASLAAKNKTAKSDDADLKR